MSLQCCGRIGSGSRFKLWSDPAERAQNLTRYTNVDFSHEARSLERGGYSLQPDKEGKSLASDMYKLLTHTLPLQMPASFA
jgi:hypothetical protein